MGQLQSEEGEGFESYSVEDLKNLPLEQKKKFIPRMISRENIELYERIINKLYDPQG